MSLPHRFAHAVQWNIIVSAATLATQLGITIILARLLTPADFGLYAIANIVFVLATHYGERGIVSAMTRELTLDREFIGSGLLLSCAISAALAVIGILLSPFVGTGSTATDKEVIEHLVWVMSLSIFVSGVSAPAQAIMQRELRFKEGGLFQFVGIVAGTGLTAIVFARWGAGPWSLAYGNLVNLAVVSGLRCWFVREQLSLAWDKRHAKRIGYIGVQMSLLRLLDVLWQQIPLVVSNIKLSSTDVGLYQRSQTLIEVGVQSTSGRFNAVVFPVMASQQDREEMLRELVPPLIGLYALFLFCASVFVAITAPDIVVVLLGPQWDSAAAPLIVVMISYACLIVSQPVSTLLEAKALFVWRIIGSAVGAVSVALFGFLLADKFGLIGIGVAAAISGLCTSAINVVAISGHIRLSLSSILSWIAPAAAVTILMAISLASARALLFSHVELPVLRLAIMTAIAGVVFVLGFRLFVGDSKRQVLAQYIAPGMARPMLIMARIFGLRMRRY